MKSMTSTERIFLRLERDGFPMDVVGITTLEPAGDTELTYDDVRLTIVRVLAEAPYLSRRVSQAPLGIGEDKWVDEAQVDLDHHVQEIFCPGEGTERDLLDLVLDLTAEPLDRSRPLWQVWLVHGMADRRSALILRGHHALTDGLGFMHLYQSIFETDPPSAPAAQTARSSAPTRGVAAPSAGIPGPFAGPRSGYEPPALVRAAGEIPQRAVITARTSMRIARVLTRVAPRAMSRTTRELRNRLPGGDMASPPGGAAGTSDSGGVARSTRRPPFVPSFTDHPPVTRFNRHIKDTGRAMAVLSLPLDEVQAARRAHPGATVNDVILAVVSGALRTYLADFDEIPDRPLVTTCPVSVRTRPDGDGGQASGNAFTAIWVDLPVQLDDPVERLTAVHARSSQAKGGLHRSRASWDVLSDLGDLLLPGMVSAAMAFAGSRPFHLIPPTQNLSVSTMRGSKTPLYFCGRKVEHLYARTIICPPVYLFIHAISYDGKLEIGILSARELLPDPEAVARNMRAELDALLDRVAVSGARS
ncbi:Diacylglycerol O-acyltransferase [Austwickia chelonae]|uniref:diacylglycerol O-acyltransferase n=1 Tax=Austwickia chelonae NBRC 105200 TaxID=1184607 RepID=K6VR63_9MICO|nr:wax ester/triacylglycerol synthase domain-containing protein [Austwickia chelonae]GAB79244.1 putative acyltransferase [Austwickia chelonae NBRC 105200]SEW37552.1 Diacylglycerol O-acyltransferase [Austwickia chelonae]